MPFHPRLPMLAAGLVLSLGTAAAARPATCQVSGTYGAADGACAFEERAGGSFAVTIGEGEDATRLSLDLTGEGGRVTGRVTGSIAGGKPVDLQPVARDTADPACWVGEGLRLCARAVADGGTADTPAPGGAGSMGIAVGEPPPGGPFRPTAEKPVSFVFRCHMDVCTWVEQTDPHEVGSGTDAVPGRLMEVTERFATREYPAGDYPDDIPADAPWEAARTTRYFCSPTRPALRLDDGSWTVLPLPEVFGATEGATNAWIHVCAPDKVQDDPYAAATTLGFPPQGSEELGETYPNFEALTAR